MVLRWLAEAPDLPGSARDALADTGNVVYVSAATIWEIAIERSIAKLEIPESYAAEIAALGFRELPVTWEHARRTDSLPLIHRDPFDRLLIAQAQIESLTLVTTDEIIGRYAVPVLPERTNR